MQYVETEQRVQVKNVIRMIQTKQIGERCDVVQVVRKRMQYVETEQRVQVKNVIQMIQAKHDGEMDVVANVRQHTMV
jgi:hypothetical protein